MKKYFFYFVSFVLALLSPLSLWAEEDYAVLKDGTLTFYYDDNKGSRDGSVYSVSAQLSTFKPDWGKSEVKKVSFDKSFANYKIPTCAAMFSLCSELLEIECLSNLNTADVDDMSYMFWGCNKLENIDLSSLNTEYVVTMESMFSGCTHLKELNLSGFNTRNLSSMEAMFKSCESIEQLDLGSFNTSYVKTMEKMFEFCYNLKTIYVGEGWSTENVSKGNSMFFLCEKLVGGEGTACDGFSNVDISYARVDSSDCPGYLTDKNKSTGISDYAIVQDGTITFYYDNKKESRGGTVYSVRKELAYGLPGWASTNLEIAVFDESFSSFRLNSTYGMFGNCSSLSEIKGIENLNTSEVTIMNQMFAQCKSLKELDLSKFNTSNVASMDWMFYGCESLTDLSLAEFETSKVESMPYMFAKCLKLKVIDLSGFNTSSVKDMSSMFSTCGYLETIFVGDGWNTMYVENGKGMFNTCFNLVGGNGTKCNGITNVDEAYAKVDKPNSPGYLTYKSSSGINDISSDENMNNWYYSLDGKRYTHARKGVFINNGRKIFFR